MAHILVIELPGGNDADLLTAAITRGDEFTFLCRRLSHYRQQPQLAGALRWAREFIEIDPFDYAEVERRVLTVHARQRIDAVLCLIDIRLVEAARLAARLGARHINPASAALLRDKYRVRCALADCGILQPEFAVAGSNQEIKLAVQRLGLPVLIKPVDGYGSQNIVVLRHPEDLDPLLSPLDELLPNGVDYGLGVTASDRVLIERCMSGKIIGCDTLTSGGRHRLLGVHEKTFFAPPSFAIRGGTFTPNCARFGDLERYVFAALDAVGFDWGAAHTEVMLTADGPRIIEINPRLVGAKIARLVGFALGRSLHADLIALHAGEPVTNVSGPRPSVAVSRWIAAPEEGRLAEVEVPDCADASIRCTEILKQAGDFVGPPMENVDRIGYVMVCDQDKVAAERLADDFISGCHVHMAGTPAGACRRGPGLGSSIPRQ
jgi:biotin carboxylase